MAVTTVLSNGVLTVTGDGAADDIAIVGTARAGELVVTGRNGTVLDGVVNGSTTVFPVYLRMQAFVQPDALMVNLGGGNDSVTMNDAYIAGSININTGDGDDTVTLAESGEVSPTGDLRIDTGAGNDVVAELNYSVFVAGGHWLELGDGHDIAKLIGTSSVGRIWPYAYSFSAFFIAGRNGNDSILAVGLTTDGYTSISGGNGANSLALLSSSAREMEVSSWYDPDLTGSPGKNTIYLDSNFAWRIQTGIVLTAPLSNLRDTSISVFRSKASVLEVWLGFGGNEVNLYANAIDRGAFNANPISNPVIVQPALSITSYLNILGEQTANAASARITMNYNIAINVDATLTHGNDSLTASGNVVSTRTTLNGHLGRNTINEFYNNWGQLTVQNFG
jgi:hypothetical protein